MSAAETWVPLGVWLAVALIVWPRVAWGLIRAVCYSPEDTDATDVAMGYLLGALISLVWPLWLPLLPLYRLGLLLPPAERRRQRRERIARLERELGYPPLEPPR